MGCERIEQTNSHVFKHPNVPKLVTSPDCENKLKLTGPFHVCCRVPIRLEDDRERNHIRFMVAIVNFKYTVIWGLESKISRDLGAQLEDYILLASDRPPKINKGIISSCFRTFLLSKPRTRWLHIKIRNRQDVISFNLCMVWFLSYPKRTGNYQMHPFYWEKPEYWRRSKFSVHDEHHNLQLHLPWEGYKKCKTSGLALLSDTNAASLFYIHDWLFQTLSILWPPESGLPALCSPRSRYLLRFLSYKHQMIEDDY